MRPLPAEALKKGALHLSKKELAKIAAEEEEQRKKIDGVEEGETSEQSIKEVAPLASTSTVDVLGHTEVEAINGGTETVEVPKEGLVCG